MVPGLPHQMQTRRGRSAAAGERGDRRPEADQAGPWTHEQDGEAGGETLARRPRSTVSTCCSGAAGRPREPGGALPLVRTRPMRRGEGAGGTG